MNILNPAVPSIFNPRRRDLVIQAIATDIGFYLDWLTHPFGRAYLLDRKVDNSRVTFPAVFNENKQYTPVNQNSFLKGSTYFILGKDKYLEEKIIQFDISIIFLVNLNLIYPTATEYHITERLIEQVEHVIPKLHPDFEFESLEQGFDDVFREYNDPELFRLKVYPLDSFRINGIFTLDLECLGTDIYAGDQGAVTDVVTNFIWEDGDNFIWEDGDNFIW